MAQPTTRADQPAADPMPGVVRARDALRQVRPDLVATFDQALPGARAAVLSRLLGALRREPLPGVVSSSPGGRVTDAAPGHRRRPRPEAGGPAARTFTCEDLPAPGRPGSSIGETGPGQHAAGTEVAEPSWVVHFADGRSVAFPEAGAQPFAAPRAGLSADLDGRAVEDPAELARALWPDSSLAAELDNSVANLALARAATALAHGPVGAVSASSGPDLPEDTRSSQADQGQSRAADHTPTHPADRRQGRPADGARHDPADQTPTDPVHQKLARPSERTAGPWVRRPGPTPGRGSERTADPWARSATLRGAAGDPDGLGRLEQLAVDGHPLHPGCRTRAGLTVPDVLAYAPEHHPTFRLRRLAVPSGRWFGDAPPVLYAHPWQAARIIREFPWLGDAGETGPVRPLMSLRTVVPVGGGDHVKTAVDVQMTSAVRTVSPAAVHNGPRLSALLRTLTADLPLTVLAETAAGAVIVDGQPQRRLACLRRQAPTVGTGETVVPLAVLGARSPADGRPLLCEAVRDAGGDPYTWMAGLADILWPPLLAVLDRGVALEAHGQNTLVVLRAGRAVRIVYRDLGGVRVSPRRLRAAGAEPPPLLGDLPSDDPAVLRTKLAAAAFGTVAAELVTLLARHHGADPARLWGIIAAAVRGTDTPDADALLREPLPVKATTAMRLAADPLDDVWTYLDNPMAGDT